MYNNVIRTPAKAMDSTKMSVGSNPEQLHKNNYIVVETLMYFLKVATWVAYYNYMYYHFPICMHKADKTFQVGGGYII